MKNENLTADYIKSQILSNDIWLYRAIRAIYDRQTYDEQQVGETHEKNGIGFNGADAQILTSFAGQLSRKGSLSQKQIEIARKKMVKYCGQLLRIAQGN